MLCSLKHAVAASTLRYFSSFVVLLIGDRNIAESCIVLYILQESIKRNEAVSRFINQTGRFFNASLVPVWEENRIFVSVRINRLFQIIWFMISSLTLGVVLFISCQ